MLTRHVLSECRSHRHGVEPVLFSAYRIKPPHIPLKGGDNFFEAFLVTHLVIEIILDQGKQRRMNSLGVLLGEHRLPVFDGIFASDCSRVLLLSVEEIQDGKR